MTVAENNGIIISINRRSWRYRMKYKIRKAVPADENKIRELFLEMLRSI